jgi:hypothetical protein
MISINKLLEWNSFVEQRTGRAASLLLDYQSLPYFEIILNIALWNSKAAVLLVPTRFCFEEKKEYRHCLRL